MNDKKILQKIDEFDENRKIIFTNGSYLIEDTSYINEDCIKTIYKDENHNILNIEFLYTTLDFYLYLEDICEVK